MGKSNSEKDSGHSYKRCPECFSKLPHHAKTCHECGQKVHEADKYGLAKKPVNWLGYGTALVLWIIFGYFLWWAFFRTP